MALFVKDPEVGRLVEKLAAIRKVSKTEVMRQALLHEFEREQAKPSLVEVGVDFRKALRKRGNPAKALPADKAFIDGLYETRMMFIDASALTAMLTDESDARMLLARFEEHPRRLTSPLAVWKTTIAVARKLGLATADARAATEEYLALMRIELVAIPPEACAIAIDAHQRFGKSRHPAALNFGDCFAYACARHYRLPLLYKGDDFPLTDVETA